MTSAQRPDRIVLTGFMGSGKSTVGRLLTEALGWTFADLDDVVTAHAGRSVPEILANAGEPAFRELECDVLQLLLQQKRLVLALGGGTLEASRARSLLHNADQTFVFHLQAPFPVLFQRCAAQALLPGAIARPLLGTSPNAQARYDRRQPVYLETAHELIDAALPSPQDVVAAIVEKLQLLP